MDIFIMQIMALFCFISYMPLASEPVWYSD